MFYCCFSSRTLRKQYCLEEGEVASRWSWLQSQIINVDRRIRRLDELYRGLRASKGPVKLQETKFVVKQPASSVRAKELSKCTPNNSTGLSTVTNAVTSNSVLSKGQADLKLKEVLGDREIHLKNGVRRGLLDEGDVPVKRLCTSLPKTESATNSVCNPAPIDELHNHSARTRGTHPSRKRLLVRLSRFQRHCKPGTVPCTCSTPETPCALCLKTCRTLPVVDVRQPLPEKVSMLDWSFHPTLSFFTGIAICLVWRVGILLEGYLKMSQRVLEVDLDPTPDLFLDLDPELPQHSQHSDLSNHPHKIMNILSCLVVQFCACI